MIKLGHVLKNVDIILGLLFNSIEVGGTREHLKSGIIITLDPSNFCNAIDSETWIDGLQFVIAKLMRPFYVMFLAQVNNVFHNWWT